MPNHVHVLFKPFGNNRLEEILHTWKSFSAKMVNRFTGQTGELWESEYFDHIVRTPFEFDRIVRYIVSNPEKSGLRNWPWVGLEE